jgi:predicted SAM-dependent methyltransferase
MKAFIRKTARKMAGWPGIGRLVRIGVAVIRLPEFRAAYDEAQRQRQMGVTFLAPSADPHAPASASRFEAEQLPGLLQAISDINHRQMAGISGQDNLVRSVPVALRKLTRETVELHGREQALSEQVGAQAQRLEQLANEVREAAARAGHAEDGVNGLAESVSYLLGRVEFVRREVMFEMRYGARAATGDKEAVEPHIVAADKVDAARQAGLRLNLGCGHVALDGYINVDRRALPGVDVVADIDHLPFDKAEVAEICSAHLLEHFPLEQLRRELLPYWVSLLRPGGKFRAIVPDGAAMARAFVAQEYDFENFRQVTFGGQDYDGDFHFNMFSTETMTKLLTEAGFRSVEVVAEDRENGGCKEFEIVAYL